MATYKLTLPSIHLNGTSKESLVQQQRDILTALDKCITAVQHSSPHMRDYYVRQFGEDEYIAARNEWVSRLSRLVTLRDEVSALGVAIMDGGHKE